MHRSTQTESDGGFGKQNRCPPDVRPVTGIRRGSKPLFRFRGFTFAPVVEGMDRMETFRLRAEIYADEFGWADSSGEIEHDRFDNFSTHYVVKSPAGESIATIRTTDHQFSWMAEECFDGVFRDSTAALKDPLTNEASRLCVRKRYRSARIGADLSVLDFLLAGLLFYNNLRGVENTCIVTFAAMGRVLARRGMAVENVSEVITMADGCRLRAFLISNRASLRSFTPLAVVDGYSPLSTGVSGWLPHSDQAPAYPFTDG